MDGNLVSATNICHYSRPWQT